MEEIHDIAAAARNGVRISPQTVMLDAQTAGKFVAVRKDPRRFVPEVFEGNWADEASHPIPGSMQLLAAVICDNDLVQVLGRQHGTLYALGCKPEKKTKGRVAKRKR